MPKRGMEAVASKQKDMQRELASKLKRKPVMQRKGEGKPGVAVTIAIGKPKGEMDEPMENSEGKACPMCGKEHGKAEMREENLSKEDKVAALEEKISYLKAELALLKDESEDESASDDEDEYEDED